MLGSQHRFRVPSGGTQKGGFQKGCLGECSPAPKSGTRVHSHVPLYQKPRQGYIRMFPCTKSGNEGTFAKTALLRNRPLVSSREFEDHFAHGGKRTPLGHLLVSPAPRVVAQSCCVMPDEGALIHAMPFCSKSYYEKQFLTHKPACRRCPPSTNYYGL